MKILLYGGTFDPPHYGHLNNLRAAASRVQPDEIVVMPAGGLAVQTDVGDTRRSAGRDVRLLCGSRAGAAGGSPGTACQHLGN